MVFFEVHKIVPTLPDMCPKKCLLVLMGDRAECWACANTRAMTSINASGNIYLIFVLHLTHIIGMCIIRQNMFCDNNMLHDKLHFTWHVAWHVAWHDVWHVARHPAWHDAWQCCYVQDFFCFLTISCLRNISCFILLELWFIFVFSQWMLWVHYTKVKDI